MFPAMLFYRIRPALMKMAFLTLGFHRTQDRNERKCTLFLQNSPKQCRKRQESPIYHKKQTKS